ncbi:MAG: LacI family transcriptional regulator [Hyphomicrobiales bacterium]|nr:LacI family transcriptional regulator [Hyphomicrobiales bacterium]
MTGSEAAAPRPTISQVADRVGVSRSTVSRAFTHPEMLSRETVEQVKKAARALGYVPNPVARALSTGRHGNIALIVPDVANPFFPPLIRSAQIRADSFDYCVFLGHSDEESRREIRLVDRLVGQAEGLVLASSRLSADDIYALADRRPLVLINRDIKGIPRVLIDSGPGVSEAVEHLAGHGHRQIAYVCGPTASWSNQQRRAAVRKAAARLKIKVTYVKTAKPTFLAGQDAVAPIVNSGVTAAIAFDDLIAQGVLSGLIGRGIAVPEAMSLVGCDDVLGAMTVPPLTSVSSRSREAGETAVSLLADMLGLGATRDVRYVLDTQLVVRATTAVAGG